MAALMSKISITNNVTRVTVNKVIRQVLVTPNQTNVTVSKTGSQGLPGNGVPAGGLAGQVLSKIDGTDYNTQWVDDTDTLSWIDVAGDVEYTGVEATIASGEVLTCDYKSDTIYRFINSTENANGYPIEDSFYSDFDGTNLTNLIVTRG
jgi:hypothetical protein